MIFIGMQANVSTTQSHQKSAKEKVKTFLSTTRGKLVIGIGSLVGIGSGIGISYLVWIKKQNTGAVPKSVDQNKSEQTQQEEKHKQQQAEKEKRMRQEADEKREMERQEEEKQRKIIAIEKLHELYATEEVSKTKNPAIINKYQEAYDAYKNGIFKVTIDIVNGALKDIKEERDAQASKQYQRNHEIVTSLQNHIVGNKLQWNCDGVLVDAAKSNATDLVVNVHGVEASDVEGMRTTLNEWEEYKKHGYIKVIFTFLKK